jgi:hypothetical protein
MLGVSKKTGKPIKPRKPEKNNRKNQTEKKTDYIFEKTGRFGFGFISKKLKKTEPNPTKNQKKKPSQTEKTEPKPRKLSQNRKNRAKPV